MGMKGKQTHAIMKKTLISAMMLLSTAFFSQAKEAVQNPTVEVYHFRADGSLAIWQGAHLALNDFRVVTSNDKDTNVDKDIALLGKEEQYYDYLCPDVNLDNPKLDNPWWNLSYTVANMSDDKVKITSLLLNMYGMHGTLEDDPQPINGDVTAYLTPGYIYANNKFSYTTTEIKLTGTGDHGLSGGTVVMQLPTGFTLNPGEDITIFMTVAAPHNSADEYTNLFVGIKSFELAGYYTPGETVPEPTTATLSLLALAAGLAARRRRK